MYGRYGRFGRRTTSELTALALFTIISWIGLAETSHAQLIFRHASASTAEGIRESVDEFRASLGTNNGTGGTFKAGRREVSWDDVPDTLATPTVFPNDFYNTSVPRGIVLDANPGTLRVSMDDNVPDDADPDQILFDDIRFGYSAQFATFSGRRLLAPVGSIVTDITFRVPGTNVPATVQAFGIMLIDVDSDTSTKIEVFDPGGVLQETIKPQKGKFVFAMGSVHRLAFQIARVRVTTGNTLMGAADSATADVVVIDDLIVSEPQPDLFEFSEGAKLTHESAQSGSLLIKRRGFLTNAASVQLTLAGTATASSDYAPPASLTVNFPAGTGEQSIHVPILNDSLREGIESVQLTLQNPSAGHVLGPADRATILIRDDERASPGFYALTEDGRLVSFSLDNLSTFASDVPIVGVDPTETLLGLDSRPADGQLYAVSHRRLYRLTPGPTSATAVPVGATFTPEIAGKGVSILDIDIDARRDQVRMLHGSYSHRLDLTTGTTVGGAIDPPLTYASGDLYEGDPQPGIVAEASTNSVPGAAATTTYGIDSLKNTLVKFDAGNPSTMRTIGPVDFGFSTVSMDIQPGTNFAFALGTEQQFSLLPAALEPRLFFVDLATGHATQIGYVGQSAPKELIALAVAPNGVLRLAAPATVNEGDTATLQIERVGGSIGSIDATITIGGTATPGVDFTAATTAIRLGEGQTTLAVPIATNEDALIEQTETIAVTLAVTPPYMAGSPLTATISLIDNDMPGSGGGNGGGGGGSGGGGGGGSTPLTYALAEGATGPFFDLDILLANPNVVSAPVTLTFLKEDASTVTQELTLAPTSRTTVRVDEIVGLEATAVSTLVTSTNGLPIVVERTMRWDASGYGAHTEKAVAGAATTWYFAEGSQGFFSTYLLLANPGDATNTATVQFLREGESPVTRTYEIAPRARMTVDASADDELKNRSFGMNLTFAQPGVAERSMYFGAAPFWTGGHESAGVTAPAASWFLAEGATGSFFETFVLLSNPQTTPADVTLTYLLANGTPIVRTRTVPASGRLTVNLEGEDPSMADAAVATQVVSSVPIVVERAQYWPDAPQDWYEAHNSFGIEALGTSWGLAEGRTGGAAHYQTYILLANPGSTAAEVTITFLRTNGTTVTKTFAVPAASRFNVATGVEGLVPELIDEEFGAIILSTQPIAVERAMYSDAGGVTWAAGTNATATRLP